MIDFKRIEEQNKILSEIENNIIKVLHDSNNPSYIKNDIINDNDNTKNIIKHLSTKDNYVTAMKLGYIYENIKNNKRYEAEDILNNILITSLNEGKCILFTPEYFASIVNDSEAAMGLGKFGMEFTKRDIMILIAQRGLGGMAGGKCENFFPLLFPHLGRYSNSRNNVDNSIGRFLLELKCQSKPGHNNAANINTGSTSDRRKPSVIKKLIRSSIIDSLYNIGIHFDKKNEFALIMDEYNILNKKSFSLSFILRGKEVNESFTLITCNEIAVDFYKRHLSSHVSESDFISFIKEWNIKTYDKLFSLQYEDYESAEWLLRKLYKDDYNPFGGDKEIFYSSVLKNEDVKKWTINKRFKGDNAAVEAECCEFYSILHYHYDFLKYRRNSDFIIIGNGYLNDEDKFMMVVIPKTASMSEVLKYVKILGPRTTEESIRGHCRIMVRDEFIEKDFSEFA
jgi:hypothetical protein